MIFHFRYPFWVNSDEAWSIGFSVSQDPLKNLDLDKSGVVSYKFIDSVNRQMTRFIADPFIVIEEDMFYLFFEHQGDGNADIGLLQSQDGKNYDYCGIVLDEPFHLSFPQVFCHQGEYYMLPETKQANNVLLYKANNFPFKWNIVDTLIQGRKLEDPAILLSDNFNLISGSEIDSMTQYFFTSDSLHGKWKEHPNYVQRRGNETRAGGSFLNIKEEWYLPLQNNSKGYGSGISLYKLSIGKKLELEEVSNMYLGPAPSIPWFANGMHHLDIKKVEDEYYFVYDGKMKRSNRKSYNYKASLKYNFHDLKNFLFGN